MENYYYFDSMADWAVSCGCLSVADGKRYSAARGAFRDLPGSS
jgi:hypothetical protein